MSVQNVTTFTEAQQLELRNRLEGVESKEDRRAIFEAYAKECGVVINSQQPGLEVERTTVDDKHILSRETTTSVNVNDIIQGMGLEEAAHEEFKKFLVNNNIQIDEQGNIKWTTPEQKSLLEQVISEYAKSNMKETLVFEDTDPEFINKLIEEGTISKNEDGTYSVLNKEKLETALPTKESENTEQISPQEVTVKATSTTTTQVEEGVVDVMPDLKHNKANRKKAEADFKAELEKWAAKPENQSTINISIAKEKYAGAISKQAAKIAKEYNNKKSDVELLVDYYTNYATDDDKLYLNGEMSNINALAFEEIADVYADASNEEEIKEFVAKKANQARLKDNLVNALNKGTKSSRFKLEDLSDPVNRRNAILYYMMQEGNFDKNILIERMATVDVMGEKYQKNPEQFEKDKKEWIKNEAKRQMKAAQTAQTVENTRVHLTGDMKKTAQKGEPNDSAVEHTDIGDYGRKLFAKCPTFFGDAVDNVTGQGDFFTDNDGNEYFKGEDGKYYKFREDLLKDFCAYACNGTIDKLSPEARERFGVDGNLTLNEGRDILKQKIFKDENGYPRSIEQLMGNADGNVGNRELNKFRNFVKTTGHSVDTNTTDLKRGLHIAKGVGIGALLGFGTGFLGSMAAGALSFAAQGAQQFIDYSADYSGVTSDRVFSGVTDPQTINDRTTFTYEIDGKTYTKTVTKNITVDGQEWSVTAPGQEYSGTVSGTKEVDGQRVNGKVKQNNLKTAANAAIFGGIAGGVNNAISAKNVHANGRNFDGIVRLEREVTQTSEPEESRLNLNVRRTRTVTVRSGETGEKIGFKPCKLRVTNKDLNTNVGETMESMVAKYYDVELGSSKHKTLMEEVRKFNNVDKFGGMYYSKGNIFNLPDKIKIDDQWFKRKYDPENERPELDTQDISLGGSYNPPQVSSQETDTCLKGRGKITKQ